MLLVDDRDPEIRKLDVALDQGVCADRNLGDAIGDLVADLLRADRAGQQHAAHTELRAQRFERQEVLLGQRFGGRHQRALAVALDRPQQGIESDDGLPRADVTLEQSLHRRRALEVGVDLGRSPIPGAR